MLNAKDLEQLSEKGISQEKIEEQLSCFEKGFPFLEIEASASVEKGIKVIPDSGRISAGLYGCLGCLSDKEQAYS